MNTRLDTAILSALKEKLEGQSMTALAEQVGTHKSSISRLANGKVALLTQLADTLERLGIEVTVTVKTPINSPAE